MLEQFFVTFGMDPMTDMTQGHEYLVTYNGADLTGYRGHDDVGDEFCMSANLFEQLPPTRAVPVPSRQPAPRMQRTNAPVTHTNPIDPSLAYTHSGSYGGPLGYHLTGHQRYDLIYDQMTGDVSLLDDRGKWVYISGDQFSNIVDLSCATPAAGGQTAAPSDPGWDAAADAIFDADNGMQDMPAPPGGGHNPTASDILGNAAPTTPMYTPEQEEEMELWTEDGDPVIAPGPASTEELREYRFKPNLY